MRRSLALSSLFLVVAVVGGNAANINNHDVELGAQNSIDQQRRQLTTTDPTPKSDLSPGDLQIVAYATDSPDAFAFVVWVDIVAGAKIYFTDKGWDCNGLISGETVIEYTVPTNGLSAGSVASFEKGAANPGFTVVSGGVYFSGYGDQLIVYQIQGANSDLLTPIFAFDTTGGWEACEDLPAKDYIHSAIPPGLEDGVSAISFSHSDVFWFRPWYSTSATLSTLKQWMTDRSRFRAYSSLRSEYEVPTSFKIHQGQVGQSGYTEYIEGNAPCIILSGHDGDLYPEEIDDRIHGCLDVNGNCDWTKDSACSAYPDPIKCRAVTFNDENTQDMARRSNDKFEQANGGARCHLIVNRLARIKLDPNREINQAAQGDQLAMQVYTEFHDYVEVAKDAITSSCGKGLLIDFHGHVHPEERIEIGYKLTDNDLRMADADLNNEADSTSIKNLESDNTAGTTLSELVRGINSIGSLFERPTANNSTGYLSVPSSEVHAPGMGEKYFQGGYNIETHGSQTNGTIDAIQIEFPRYLRANNWDMQEDVLTAFGETVLPEYLTQHYGFQSLIC